MELTLQEILYFIGIPLIAIIGLILKKIDWSGAIAGTLTAFVIWLGGGAVSLFALFLFFVLGSFATSWKNDIKSQYKIQQENNGKRGVSNVLANGGVAVILSICVICFPEGQHVFRLMIISSFAAACSDTLSSEFGNIYGKTYYNIITLKEEKRGLDGAVSREGLLFGFIGTFVISISTLFFQYDLESVFLIVICGLVGNLIDSFLGASLQQKGFINNHQVNFLATLSAALIAAVCFLLIN